MPELPPKQRSGCKIVGCGCLILAGLLALAIGLSTFFFLRSASPGKIEAHHFVPRDAAGTMVLNLHKDDAGLTAIYELALEEALKSEDIDIPGWLTSVVPGLSESSLHEGPVGPRVLLSLPRTLASKPTLPLIIIDLHTYSRAASAALQISLKTTGASLATESVYRGITLYDDKMDMFDFALHKGFLIAAGDMDTLRSGVDALEIARAAEWPKAPAAPEGCDLQAAWSGDFTALAVLGIQTFGLEAPRDGDFVQPVQDVTQAELCIDVVSADQLTFTLQGVTETAEAAHRVAADLQEHARELQTRLKDSNLDLQFATRIDSLNAILTGELNGLEGSIRTLIHSEENIPGLQEEPVSGE